MNYRIFQQNFGFENYLNILPDDLSKAFCHFRSLNHKMPIEWGRYLGTERVERICEVYSLHKIGDEFHYILECTYFDGARKVYLPRNLIPRPNVNVFHNIMNSSDTQLVSKVEKYCKIISRHFMRFSEIFNYIVDFGRNATYGVVLPKSTLPVILLVPFECPQHMASLFSSRTVFICVLGAKWSCLIETVRFL